jgi:hypothetical protein
MKKFLCPCCEHLTYNSEPPGTFEVCPVCYWEDDNVQYENPSFDGGANNVSLIKAKSNYKSFGAIEEKFINDVRKPNSDEIAQST